MKKQTSSGAKKAEKLTTTPKKKSTAKKPPVQERTTDRKVALAELKEEKKQKRLEKKLEHKQKNADRKAYLAERRRERKQKMYERMHESKEARRERKLQEQQAKIEARKAKMEQRAAERETRREHRLRLKAERAERRNSRQHTPGFGGWLAAVISLGTTTLALGTVVTMGWLAYGNMQEQFVGMYAESMYELNAIIDNLDVDLRKATVANSEYEQVRVLTDLATESELAETLLERMPIDGHMTEQLTAFVNKVSEASKQMLYTVAGGNQLSDSQKATIAYMAKTNGKIKENLNELTTSMNQKEWEKVLSGRSEWLLAPFEKMQNMTVEVPKEIQDGPFAEQREKVSPKAEQGKELSCQEAKEKVRNYFESYGVSDIQCTGEVLGEVQAYNMTLSTDYGTIEAQIAKNEGKLVAFNSYKDCSEKKFDVQNCIRIAQQFLENLGATNMTAVWASESGSTCDLNFVYEQEGVLIYSDMIKCKVCEERGVVVGMEGMSYVKNHTKRTLPTASLTKAEAKGKVSQSVEWTKTQLALIPMNGEEVLTYEMIGERGEELYYVYVDAETGDELQILTVVNTAHGRALM